MISKIIGYIKGLFYCIYNLIGVTDSDYWYKSTCGYTLSFNKDLAPGQGYFIYCPRCRKRIWCIKPDSIEMSASEFIKKVVCRDE